MVLALLGVSWALLGLPWISLGASRDSLAALLERPWFLLGPFGLTWEPLGSQGSPGRAPGFIFCRFVCGFLTCCDDYRLILCLFLVAAGAVDVYKLNVFRWIFRYIMCSVGYWAMCINLM